MACPLFPSSPHLSPPSPFFYLCVFSNFLCSNFPSSSQPCNCSVSSQFWQTFLFIFFPHLLSYFWPYTPSQLSPKTTRPTIMFCSLFPLDLVFFLQSSGSSFTLACFFQCCKVIVEYSKSAVEEREGTICSLCIERGQLWSRVWSADVQAQLDKHTHTSTYRHRAMMIRPFPPSSPDPHLNANEKHDNYPQLFAPQSSAVVILVLI